MSNQEIMKDDLHFIGDTACINLWYPDVEENDIDKIQIGLMDVWAADDIRIWYDKERDGWVIEQASIFEWDADNEIMDADWHEVAFVQAWGRSEKYKRAIIKRWNNEHKDSQ